jgi:hypothetical protein
LPGSAATTADTGKRKVLLIVLGIPGPRLVGPSFSI